MQRLWVFQYKVCECFLEYASAKDYLTEHNCLCCNNDYQKSFDENLKKRFINACKFSYHNINKFILLLWKGVYPYEYMEWLGKVHWNFIT